MTVYLSNRDGNGKTNEEGHYRLLSKVLTGKVVASADLQVTQNSPLGLSVLVNSGDWRLETSGGNYAYTGWNDAPEAVTITTPDASNPRITVIVLYVDKAAATSASPPNNPGVAKLMAVNGAASATPVTPSNSAIQSAVGSNNPYMILATVRVNAATTQITNSNITDMREQVKLSPSVLSPATIVSAIGPLLYPVGSIYTNATSSTNPATLMGFGTWSQFGQGRVLVSVDSGDSDFSLGAIGGEKAHTITIGELPAHRHRINPLFMPAGTGALTLNDRNGDSIMLTDNAVNGVNGEYFGSNKYTENTGNGEAANNMQPYIAVYMWRRTA